MLRIPIGVLATLAALCALSPTALAQPSANIRDLPNLTEPQRKMGAAIDVVCPNLASRASSLNRSQTDLLARCGEMKQTALVLSGGTSARNLDLTFSQYQDVLLGLSHDEASAQGTSSTEVGSRQSRSIGSRLAALRAGASGIRVSGLLDGVPVALDLLKAGDNGLDAGAAEETGTRLGAFLNGHGSFGRRDTTDREPGFDFHDGGVTAGVDYRFLPSLVAGLAFTFLSGNSSFHHNLGDVDTKSYGFAAYGTYYSGPLYIDAAAGFAWTNYDTERRIVYTAGPNAGPGVPQAGRVVDRTAHGDTDGWQATLHAGAGYDFKLGGFTLTPTIRLEAIYVEVDRYSERGADGLDLQVKSQDLWSVQSGLGARVAYAIGTSIVSLIPQLSIEWRHEFADNERSITAKYLHDPTNTFFSLPTNDPDRDYVSLGVGLSMYFARGVSAFVHYETALALRHVTNHQFTAGFRMEF